MQVEHQEAGKIRKGDRILVDEDVVNVTDIRKLDEMVVLTYHNRSSNRMGSVSRSFAHSVLLVTKTMLEIEKEERLLNSFTSLVQEILKDAKSISPYGGRYKVSLSAKDVQALEVGIEVLKKQCSNT